MGGDPAAVVDPQLRVRGVEGLRVLLPLSHCWRKIAN
jgi:hypothetical protein